MRSRKVVVIGGGTGVSNMLRGIKLFNQDITAIVTMADDGGGSGFLRREMGILPPGDLRNCLVALANSSGAMENLLQFRFQEGVLKGQNFGNLLIAALTEIYQDFETAIEETAKVLNISGKVYPVTLDNVHLEGEFENGDKCIGESKIPVIAERENLRIKKLRTFPEKAVIFPKAKAAIEQADIVILGPGSLYTSLISNLVVEGVAEALLKTKAKKYYVSNIMTEPGETGGYSIKDHVKAIRDHGGDIVDKVLINVNNPKAEVLERYENENYSYIEYTEEDRKYLEDLGIEVICGNFINDENNQIRHSAIRVFEKILIDYNNLQ